VIFRRLDGFLNVFYGKQELKLFFLSKKTWTLIFQSPKMIGKEPGGDRSLATIVDLSRVLK